MRPVSQVLLISPPNQHPCVYHHCCHQVVDNGPDSRRSLRCCQRLTQGSVTLQRLYDIVKTNDNTKYVVTTFCQVRDILWWSRTYSDVCKHAAMLTNILRCSWHPVVTNILRYSRTSYDIREHHVMFTDILWYSRTSCDVASWCWTDIILSIVISATSLWSLWHHLNIIDWPWPVPTSVIS